MKSIATVRDLGAEVKEIREARGWTHVEAAAWVGVGARFLFDLERGKRTVQMDMALQVAAKLGIRLGLSGPGLSIEPGYPLCQKTKALPLLSPVGHPAPRAWLTLRYAALSMAKNCGLNVVAADLGARHSAFQEPSVLIHTEVPDQSGRSVGSLLDWCRRTGTPIDAKVKNGRLADSVKEETGGPTFANIIGLARAHARHTLATTEQLVRWFVFSVMIADTEVDIECVRVCWSEANPEEFDLLPFQRTMCFASGVTERPQLGFRIAKVWDDGGLRADQWIRFAKDVAGVHPKVIFQLMQSLGVRVPGLLDTALLDLLGQPPTLRPVVDAVREVRRRAERMMELMMLAKPNVSGLATKRSLLMQPVPTRLKLPQPKRLFNPNIDDMES